MANEFQEVYTVHANRQDQKRNFPYHIVTKTLDILNKDRILKAKKAWIDALQVLKDHRCQLRLSYPANLSVVTEGERKTLNDEAD